MNDNKIPIGIRLRPSQIEALRILSKKMDRPRAWIVDDAIKRYPAMAIAYDLARAVIDQARDGIDRSEHIRKLAEAYLAKAKGGE